jgi:nicotinamide riboside kinase
VRRIALLGGESSGKTTLARALAQSLGTSWVPEYGRQRWEELRITCRWTNWWPWRGARS